MSETLRVLIAGCGYVGTALGLRLTAAGHRVWGLRRDPGDLPSPIEPLAADLAAPSSLASLPRDLDWVVYAAAAGGFSDERYRTAYVDGPRNLLAALATAGSAPRRVAFTSSTGVYAQSGGEWVDETSPTEPTHFSGTRLLQGERLFLDSSLPAVVARLGGIYGPGRTRLIEGVLRGEERCAGGPPTWTNRIHRDDAAGAVAHLLTLPDPAPVYLVVDEEPAERCEVVRWIAERLGADPPPRGGDPGERTQRSNKRVSSRRLQSSGYRFLYPTYREGYGELISFPGGLSQHCCPTKPVSKA